MVTAVPHSFVVIATSKSIAQPPKLLDRSFVVLRCYDEYSTVSSNSFLKSSRRHDAMKDFSKVPIFEKPFKLNPKNFAGMDFRRINFGLDQCLSLFSSKCLLVFFRKEVKTSGKP